MKKFQKGFTIFETIITISILVVLVSIVLPSFNTMRNNQVLKSAALDIVSALDRAKSLSTSSIDSSEYGVHFESGQIVIFKGTSFSPVSPDNEVIMVYSPASISSINLTGGATDVYFDRLTGAPNKTGTVTISLGSLNKIITISATGVASMN